MTATTPPPALVLFAHGARDPAWAGPFHALRDALRAADPARRVEIAYLELMTPGLPDAVEALAAEGVREVVVVPVFLGRGGHLRRDLPVLLDEARSRAPQVQLRATAAVGELAAVIDAMSRAILVEIGGAAGTADGAAGTDDPAGRIGA